MNFFGQPNILTSSNIMEILGELYYIIMLLQQIENRKRFSNSFKAIGFIFRPAIGVISIELKLKCMRINSLCNGVINSLE